MLRLRLLVGLVAVIGCDGAEPQAVDVAPLAGVYTGTHTADALGEAPVTSPASVTVATDRTTRAISFTLAVRGEAPVVMPGTVAASGTIVAGNLLAASALGVEFVADPAGTIRGVYEVAVEDSVRATVAGTVAGTFTRERFDLTLVEPEAGGVRVEVRTVR
ncbi:MAG: hypothetical protein CMM85_05355 [Rhodothermaceae bacterium]|nr:hypothetical protein [Rhodothermaceae bacterium]